MKKPIILLIIITNLFIYVLEMSTFFILYSEKSETGDTVKRGDGRIENLYPEKNNDFII